MTLPEGEVIFCDIVPIAGFHPAERDQLGPFVWTRGKFSIRKPEGIRYVDLFLCYYGTNGRLVIGKDSAHGPVEITLIRGWSRYAVDLRNLEQCDLDFEVTPLIPVPGELRELGVMIRHVRPFQDVSVYELERKKMTNKCRNVQEFLSGRSRLVSLPTRLRVDIESRCNMLPRCAYCEWEWVKEMEDHDFLREPLTAFEELGHFFECAEEVASFSHGEPLLNPNLEAILEKIAGIGARFDITTNGHLLDRTTRNMLLGKNVFVNISIDAATDETYRRFRHGSLDRVMENIRALSEAKRDHDNLPHIFVSFIAMRSNLAEFESFLDRMIEVGVDTVRVMSLREKPYLPEDAARRGFPGFDYRSEILPPAESLRFQNVAKTCAENKGVRFIGELDFCRELEEIGGPMCNEPWQMLYVLKRGIVPCCFSMTPLEPWHRRGNRPLIEFVAEVWNGRLMREIREALAAGEFHAMCKMSGDCRIMKRKSLGL
jgi:MoaA/NifB/PqqE/SkfB family radical SAM enzyme